MKPDTHGTHSKGWIGVDLDGTLASYHGWVAPTHIGCPVPPMVARVEQWLVEGKDVRILTARVYPGKEDHAICRDAINEWLTDVFGQTLPITHEKDHAMIELWDDRCVQVIPNYGLRADNLIHRLWAAFSALLCRCGNHDWRDGPGSKCVKCGEQDNFWGTGTP